MASSNDLVIVNNLTLIIILLVITVHIKAIIETNDAKTTPVKENAYGSDKELGPRATLHKLKTATATEPGPQKNLFFVASSIFILNSRMFIRYVSSREATNKLSGSLIFSILTKSSSLLNSISLFHLNY